jgi:plastocyanin
VCATFLFSQDIILTLDGGNLNYNSSSDIAGFQFSHDGCVLGAGGGDAAAYGFTVSASGTTVLAFSFSSAIIPSGQGTLVELDGDIVESCITATVFSAPGGVALDAVFGGGDDGADYVVEVGGEGNSFSPENLQIDAGETVEWVNMGGFHNVDGSTDTYPNNPDSFYSGNPSNGAWTYSFTFEIEGVYDYDCSPHASMGMSGTITVGDPVDLCTDESACNAGDEGDCEYAATNYDCDGNCTAALDCSGECGGAAIEDECGVCGGNGSSCAESEFDVYYSSDADIYGFQFDVSGVSVTGVSGGAAAAAGFSLSSNSGSVLGFSIVGGAVLAGEGVLATVSYSGSGNPCLSGLVLSGQGGSSLDASIVDCLTVSYAVPCGDEDGDGICDDEDDCVGEYDECGICGGDGIAEGACDCDGNILDCSGDCGGSAGLDECGVCNGGGIAEGDCDCNGNVLDCSGECGGSASVDCAGECGGTSGIDSCGVCGGDGTSCQNSVDLSLVQTDIGVDIYMTNSAPVEAFQFSVSGISLSGVNEGGSAEQAGFSVSTGPNGVVGFSMTLATIGSGSGLLASLAGDFYASESCIGDLVLSVDAEGFLTQSTGDCIETGWSEPEYTADILYNSDADIYGFQFDVSGVTLVGVSGGAATDAGFSVSSGSDSVIGFSLTGGVIPAGNGVLVTLTFTGDGSPCLGGLVLSGQAGSQIDASIEDCLTIYYDAPCDDEDADSICDDVDDCVGEFDECGVCNGDGIPDDACTCDGAVLDCLGVCGGTVVDDECGNCGGNGPQDNFDCDGNCIVDFDCLGECGGSASNCPDWEDCPSCYENTASMTAIVLDALSGDQVYGEDDVLAAFDVDGNVRGIALHLYPVPFGPFEGTGLYEIQIRGDVSGEAISFKYYDASQDEVLDSGTGYTFEIDDIIGSVTDPHGVSIGAVMLSIDIASGWNWFSLNVEGDMGIGSVMGSLSSVDGDFIKSQSSSATYYPDFGWYGGLDEFGVTGMYKFNSANGDVLTFSGAPVDPSSTPIGIEVGWNWLGFTPQNDGPTSDALASIDNFEGDFIKSQASSATYYESFGWYGGLEVMAPTEGYMLNVSAGSDLIYPNFGTGDALSRSVSVKDMPLEIFDWQVDYHNYEFNGHITMSIDSREDSYGDYIAIFSGDECRGVAERMYFPFGDSYMYSLMAYSNSVEGETLTFKYYDSIAGEVIEYAETIEFTSDMIEGDGFNTFSLSREVNNSSHPAAYSLSEAYPNPFNPMTSFTYSLAENGFVQVAIYDINGKMISELTNGYMSAGSYPLVWNAGDVSSGVYFIRMLSGEFVSSQKIVLVK